MSYRTEILVGGRKVTTLADILPASGPMRMLIVGKTPALISVEKGHYFQGPQGTAFWNRLRDYGLLTAPPGKHEDEVLLEHGFGITDVVKAPRDFGNEPTDVEYEEGARNVRALIRRLAPVVTMFVYKRALDRLLSVSFGGRRKAGYGFNPDLTALLHTRVFAFPMPGTPVNSVDAHRHMAELVEALASAT